MKLKQRLMSQFGKPQGPLGRIAGAIMANRPSNVERNEWTLSLLDLRPSDRVLEIGFGPGIAIQRAAEATSQGVVVGLDHSQVMLSQASRRNASSLSEGRVMLLLGGLAALSELAGPFDKIFSVNAFMFWHEPVAVLQALRRLLAPEGVIATTLQPRGDSASEQDTIRMARTISDMVREAGFSGVRNEIKTMKPVSVACVLAAAPSR